MQGVVPAAGAGTRLRPLTDDRPKGLVEVAGRPLCSYAFEALRSAGVDELVVVVGYRGEQLRERYGDDYRGVPVTYVRQDERRGLAHALRQAAPRLSGDVLQVNGDNVFEDPGEVARVSARHRETGAAATLLVERVDRATARETGVVVTDEEGRVERLVEKPDDPPSTLALGGAFALSPAAREAAARIEPSERGEYELPDAIDLVRREGGRVETVRLQGWRLNVNTPGDVERATARLAAGR